MGHGGCGSTVTSMGRVKLLRVHWVHVRTVFHHQFEAVVRLNWAPQEKATHRPTVLQGQAADILHSGPAEAMYEDVQVFKDHCGDNQLAAAYHFCKNSLLPSSSWPTGPLSGYPSTLSRERQALHLLMG
jgi:hypothetical protein